MSRQEVQQVSGSHRVGNETQGKDMQRSVSNGVDIDIILVKYTPIRSLDPKA